MDNKNAITPTPTAKKKHHWWQRLKNAINALLSNKNAYSWAILIMVPLSEILALWALRLRWTDRSWLPLMLWGVTAALMGILWWTGCHHKLKFSVKSKILTRLLANAVVPRSLGVCYLLTFAIHIGWIGNAIANMFVGSVCWADAVVSVLACVMGMLFITVFFPDGRTIKDENRLKTVFVSGMSTVNVPRDNNLDQLNVRPLVRMLQLMPDEDCDCEMLILRSNQEAKKESVFDVLRLLGHDADISEMPTEDQLRTVIRQTAKREFPEKKWIDTMAINFTEPQDYNDFPMCYNALAGIVEKLDDNQHQLLFNLTPGTGIIGSLMTLLAIDGDRELYYYSQDSNLSDERRLVKVDKTQVPLENLLSQALEKMENE